MKRVLLAVIFLSAVSSVLSAAGGNGGPMGMYYNVGLGPLNKYMSENSLPDFVTPIPMWGGIGTNWLTKNFGIGGMIVGGFDMKFNLNSYGAIYMISAGLPLQSIIYESKIAQVNAMFGPGYNTNHFVFNSAGSRHEFVLNSMMFFFAVSAQFKVLDVTWIEIDAGYNFVSSKEWKSLDAADPAPVPDSTDLSGSFIALVIKFGGNYLPESTSITLPAYGQ